MAAYELRFRKHDLHKVFYPLVLVEKIKVWRAFLLRRCREEDYLFIHRNVAIEHEYSQSCICDPVTITQNDFRPSLYFANEILNPTMH
jgi:hypothetical protein